MSELRPGNLLFVCAESAPWVKQGGLGDVMGALPAALAALGPEVSVVLPLYSAIDREKAQLKPLAEIPVEFLGNSFPTRIFTCLLPGGKGRALFIENQYYFERQGVYTDPASGEGWPDEDERYFFFQLAVARLLEDGLVEPELVVCADWQAAMLPALLRIRYRENERLSRMKLVMSLHNLGYQGVFPAESIDKLELSRELLFPLGSFEYYGQLNCLKAGISLSDRIITVSPTYAREILDSEQGAGLDGVLRQHQDRLSGILNGIDTTTWNPSKDPHLAATYNANKLNRKSLNRRAVLEAFGMNGDFEGPVIGIVSRLTDQKGLKILAGCLDRILSRDMKMIILGTGDKTIERFLSDASRNHPDSLGVRIEYNEGIAHLVEAGADMFLMPSLYEPCGLNQMYSMAYGTLPIVRETGGLKDTVIDFLENADKATGFSFKGYNAAELLDAVDLALSAWKKPRVWRRMQKNAMKLDFSWQSSAERYMEAFRGLLAEA